MQVISVEPASCYYVTIKGTSWEPWKEFRRAGGSNHWEVLMGMSFEEVGDSDELEQAFTEFMS